MSSPDTTREYGENELPEDSEERAIELKAIEKEDSATEQYLEDQRM